MVLFVPAYQRLWKPPSLEADFDEPMEDIDEPMQPADEQQEYPENLFMERMEPQEILSDEEVIIGHLRKYLSNRDKLISRGVSSVWNNMIRKCPKFQTSLQVKFRDNIHKELKENHVAGRPSALHWNSVKFHHFCYQRNSEMFKNYWHCASSYLDTLTLANSSFECDAFEFLLDHCPVLRTLNLIECKLRDLDDYHGQDIVKRMRLGAPSPDPVPIRCGLKNLKIESMYKIEQCFFDYLVTRTGELESFSLIKCFFPASEKERPQVEAMIKEFLPNLQALLYANLNSLRKYELNANNFQTEVFATLTPPQRRVDATHLTLGLTQPVGNNYEEIVRFMNNCQGVQKLSLKFLGNVDTATLQALLTSSAPTIQKFELEVVGNLIGRGEPLNLDILARFAQLEEIKIQDSKNLRPSDTRKVVGGQRRKDCPEWRKRESRKKIGSMDYRPEMLTGLVTNVQSSFIQNLSPNGSLRKLALGKYITLDNFLTDLVQNLQSFRNLTKLEIRGPWIHSMDGVVQLIVQNLLELETLVLNDCTLDDTHMTGLNKTKTDNISSQLAHEYENFTTIENLLAAIELGIASITNNEPQRLRLSQLPKLKCLDLSMNPKITNVSLVDALKIPGLKVLNLNCCYQMRNNSLEFIPLLMPNLEYVHVKQCREMTKIGLNNLVMGCPKLRKVYTTRNVQNRPLAAGNGIVLSPNYKDIVVPAYGYCGMQMQIDE